MAPQEWNFLQIIISKKWGSEMRMKVEIGMICGGGCRLHTIYMSRSPTIYGAYVEMMQYESPFERESLLIGRNEWEKDVSPLILYIHIPCDIYGRAPRRHSN